MPRKTAHPSQTIAAILGLAAAYFLIGKFGLALAFVNASASAVWPPSGLAFAVLLLWGYRLWPGIFAGALLVNITTQGSLATALGIATGNTLEAVVGVWLVRNFANGTQVFERARDIFKFALFAALCSTALAATFGVRILALGGFARPEEQAAIWVTWWLGDMCGDLMVAPLLVIWLTQPFPRFTYKRVLEATGLLFAVIVVGQLIFMGEIPSGMEYMATLPLLWAAFRFGQRGAVTAAFVISVVALAGTLRGVGPFVTADPNQSLLLMQSFVGTMTIATLVLASVISERRRLHQRLEVQDAISRILAESPALHDAAPRIVQVLCQLGGWEVGAIWLVDRTANRLVCLNTWHVPGASVTAFAAITRASRFPPGVGFPGRVWSSGHPEWTPDVTKPGNFPRAPVAAKEGLHAAFAFPIRLGWEVLGVIECFSSEVREPDEEFLQMVSHIGERLGQFIERKRAEESLRAKEAQLRLITDTAPVMLSQSGIDRRYKFVNRAYADRFSLTPEQIVGKSIVEILGEPAYAALRDKLEKVQRGEIVEYEIEVPYERIGRRFMRVAHVPDRDANGNVIGWVSAISDMSERKKAEEARQQSEALKGAMLDSALDCIISIDHEGTILEFNPAAERTFGYRRSDALGKPLDEVAIPPRLREGHRRGFAKYLATGHGSLLGRRVEMSAMRADGTEFPAEFSINSIQLGQQTVFTAYLRDITQRKKSEAALQSAKDELAKANEALEERVQQRTAELQRANAALLHEIDEGQKLEAQLRQAQKMESIGTLAGGIAHDFNNILNIIKGYAAVLRRASDESDLDKTLDVIDETAQRGAAIVQQLLAIARRNESNFESIKLNDSLGRLKKLLGGIFPKTIEIELDLDKTLPLVKADQNQIDQVLINICLNARDAMPDGGQLLLKTGTVSGSLLRQKFETVSQEHYAYISISDSGQGMSETVRSRVFEPFFTTKEESQGTGLGLSVAYGIIANHEGFIDVSSHTDHGTTFSIYLPSLSSGSAADWPPLAERKSLRSSGSGHAVLFVEDEVQQLNLMRRLLESEGYRVFTAADGVEAVEQFFSHKDEISTVVLDIGLPKLNGWQAFQKMKEAEPTLQPIIATGYTSAEIKSALSRGELSAVIMKPYRLDDVLEKIAASVAESDAKVY